MLFVLTVESEHRGVIDRAARQLEMRGHTGNIETTETFLRAVIRAKDIRAVYWLVAECRINADVRPLDLS